MTPTEKRRLYNLIDAQYSEMINNMREYHDQQLKEMIAPGQPYTDADIEHAMMGLSYNEWEDVAFTDGYMAALRNVRDWIRRS